jgi:DNA-binding LacI/PurR family transcriptional regulator/DNA-binding transcriptional regulator YhcF (GntR family)
MTLSHVKNPVRRIVQLADEIELDITRRKLSAGDRYLRTAETAKMLGVKIGIANQALQLLVQRQRLVRRTGSGTFVVKPEASDVPLTLRNVRVLANDRLRALEVMLESGELIGLQRELPGVSIQLETISVDHEESQLNNIIAAALKSRNTEGFVLLGSTVTMQRALAASGLPAVVQGRLYPSVRGLPFVNSDDAQAGKLAIEHILSQGYQRVVLLIRPVWYLGAQIIVDEVLQAIDRAGLSAGILEIRFVPDDEEAIRAVVDDALRSSKVAPGFITVSKTAGDVIFDLAKSRKLKAGRHYGLVVSDVVTGASSPPYPYLEREYSPTEYGALVAEVLKEALQSGMPSTIHRLVPVRLKLPK